MIEFVDSYDKPNLIIESYQKDVTLKEIRQPLMFAY